MNNRRWPVPRWLLFPVFGVLILSGMISLLVCAARQQPADNKQCLKISPSSGPLAYIYFDAHSGTRLNMPRNAPPASQFERESLFIESPDRVYWAVFLRSVTTPINYVSVQSIVSDTRRYRAFGTNRPIPIGWSADGKYLALKLAGRSPDNDTLSLLAANDLHDVLTLPISAYSGAWSPRDNRFAYLERRNGNQAWLTIVSLDSQPVSILLAEDFHSFSGQDELPALQLVWSPDAEYIAIGSRTSVGIVRAAADGTFQLVSERINPQGRAVIPNTTYVRWFPQGHSLIYLDSQLGNARLNLLAFAPENNESKILASNLIGLPAYSPDGRYAVITRTKSLEMPVVDSFVDLSRGKETLVFASSTENAGFPKALHWSNDANSVVMVVDRSILYIDVAASTSPSVRIVAIGDFVDTKILDDNSWLSYRSTTDKITHRQYLNLQTGERYTWDVDNSTNNAYLNYWPGNPPTELKDAYTFGQMRLVSADDSSSRLINPADGVLPWLANTKILTYVEDGFPSSTVHLLKNDGTPIRQIPNVGRLPNGTLGWFTCSALT